MWLLAWYLHQVHHNGFVGKGISDVLVKRFNRLDHAELEKLFLSEIPAASTQKCALTSVNESGPFAMKRISLIIGVIGTIISVGMHKNQRSPALSTYIHAHTKGWSGRYELYSQFPNVLKVHLPQRSARLSTHSIQPARLRTFSTTTRTSKFTPANLSVAIAAGHTYDAKQKLIRAIQYDPDGNVTRRDEYRYDASDRLTEIIDYSSNGTITEKSLFAYEPTKRQTTVT